MALSIGNKVHWNSKIAKHADGETVLRCTLQMRNQEFFRAGEFSWN